MLPDVCYHINKFNKKNNNKNYLILFFTKCLFEEKVIKLNIFNSDL